MREHETRGVVSAEGIAISEEAALGALISRCRDQARDLRLAMLACLLDMAAQAVDEDLARKAAPPSGADPSAVQ